ncbi:MAG: hypothetical protein V4801_10300 [Burkholderia gladioli]
MKTSQQSRDEVQFWEKAFLTALPQAILVQGWTYDGKTISNALQRAELAGRIADFSVKERSRRVTYSELAPAMADVDVSDGGNAD